MEKYLVIATFVGALLAILFAVIMAKRVLSFDEGTEKMKKIAEYIRTGANVCNPLSYGCV